MQSEKEPMMTMPADDLDQLEALTAEVAAWGAAWQRNADRSAVARPDAQFAAAPLPQHAEGAAAAFAAFRRDIAPGLSASVGPRYLGFVTGGVTPAALLGDWLASAVDQNLASPGDSLAPLVERQALGWLGELFDLPSAFEGVLTTGATAANLLGLLCARQHGGLRQGMDIARDGWGGARIEVFAATPHASSVKALALAGFGREAYRRVACLPDSEAMDVAALGGMLDDSTAPGKVVIASAGTVTGTDFDDLGAIAALCKRHGAWLHVDGAFGLFSRLTPARRSWTDGLEYADSITSDGHKWLNVPYDCGFFFTRHAALLQQTCSVSAPYLDLGVGLPAMMDRGIENSRRFRALSVWFCLRAYGRAGVAAWVEANCRQAAALAAWLDDAPGYTLLKPPRLNVVVFRPAAHVDARVLMTRINQSGEAFVTPGVWQGTPALRAAFSNWRSGDGDVRQVCALLARLAGDEGRD
jgi:glutamate/tyrosine decarboxylase-like PLP-dependent enzyme